MGNALQVGDVVRLTEYAAKKNLKISAKKCKSGLGTVTRIKDGHPSVLWDGYAIPQSYHPAFIERAHP